MKSIFSAGILVVSLWLLACSTPRETVPKPAGVPVTGAGQAPVSEVQGWEKQWKDTLAEAKKEGKVVVYSTSGSEVRRAFNDAFTKKYGIDLEMVVAKGAEVSNKVLSERRAGLYMVDVYVGGSTTIITALKPAGSIDPLRPALILPEVTDPNVWWEKRIPITVDRENKYILQYSATLNLREILLNGDQVREGELTSYHDLLQPKWKEKIAMMDPITAGRGLKWFGSLIASNSLNLDYMRQLAKQEPFITRNDRLGVEWVARGKYLVGIALAVDPIKEFMEAGFNLKETSFKEDVPRITAPGGGNITLMNKAPHPAAARVFINWMLSKEGQTVWSRATSYQSARIDVSTDHIAPYNLRVAGLNYFETENEDFLEKQTEQSRQAREIFGHLMR